MFEVCQTNLAAFFWQAIKNPTGLPKGALLIPAKVSKIVRLAFMKCLSGLLV